MVNDNNTGRAKQVNSLKNKDPKLRMHYSSTFVQQCVAEIFRIGVDDFTVKTMFETLIWTI